MSLQEEPGHLKVEKVDVWVQSNCFILAGAVEEPKGEFYFTYLTDFFFFKFQPGLLRTDPVPEEGEDVAAAIGATETLSEEEQEELRRELAKVKMHSFWDFVLHTHNSFVFLRHMVTSLFQGRESNIQ